MSELSNRLQGLLDFLEKRGHSPPTRKLRIVEITRRAPTDAQGRIRIKRSELRDPAEYEARFDTFVKAGMPWINVSCVGVLGEFLVVGIEVPEAPPKPADRTSVNYSGPSATVLGHAWDVSGVLEIN